VKAFKLLKEMQAQHLHVLTAAVYKGPGMGMERVFPIWEQSRVRGVSAQGAMRGNPWNETRFAHGVGLNNKELLPCTDAWHGGIMATRFSGLNAEMDCSRW
jgi:hypothetical protein